MSTVTRTASAYAGGEAMRTAKSKTIDFSLLADGDMVITIPIPRKTLVKRVYQQGILDGDGTGTYEIGFTGNGETADPNYFASAQNLSDLGGILDPAILDVAKYFDTVGGAITVTLTKGTSTLGKLRLFADYVTIY